MPEYTLQRLLAQDIKDKEMEELARMLAELGPLRNVKVDNSASGPSRDVKNKVYSAQETKAKEMEELARTLAERGPT